MEFGGKGIPRPSSHDADSASSELVSGEESGFVMVASDTASSVSPVLGLVATDSPTGLEISFLVLARRSGSKARTDWGRESLEGQVSSDISDIIQVSKANLVTWGVAVDLL